MSMSFGHKIKVSLFGQSHAPCVGIVADGLPAGEQVDLEALQAFMDRRKPGAPGTTPRKEADRPRILTGLVNGMTCGAPLCLVVDNTDVRSADYENLRYIPRPGHSDYAAVQKWGEFHDGRGGGLFSARLTAALCALGGILMQMYARRGIAIGAHLVAVGDCRAERWPLLTVSREDFYASWGGLSPMQEETADKMRLVIDEARRSCNSVGGIVEAAIVGLEPGLGEPVFDGIENRISQAVFAIPAVKGIEFGEGFAAAALHGTENNDAYGVKDGKVQVKTNHGGGILGGLTSGAPVVFRAAFKPTSSIALKQDSVDLRTMTEASLGIRGRHDPCVAVRAVPVVEAAAALAIADFIL